ncbi:MAG: DUF4349 domain-containing protein [Thermodesulfobacteriota bacterium]
MKTGRQTKGFGQSGLVWLTALLVLSGLGCHKKMTFESTPTSPAAFVADSEPAVDLGDLARSEKAEAETAVFVDQRMIFYDGFVKLRAVKPEEVIDAASKLAASAGGYVEQMRPGRVVLRIPAAQFEVVYQAALKLAEVLEKSVSARDITESFQDTALRLSTAVAARDRLVELLGQSRDEKEKIRLLKEIQRLNDQIESLENLKAMLSTMAAFSKLTILVEQRRLVSGRADPEEIAEFRWISLLSPFKREAQPDSRRLDFAVPPDMLALDREGLFIAEGADGAAFWSTTRPNRPEGDNAFWIEAIKVRLSPEFKEVDTRQAGDFTIVRFVENAETPYVYLIGVNIAEKRLELVQVYFPSKSHEERYGAGILDSITRGAR